LAPAAADKEAMPVSFSIADSSDRPRKVVIWVNGDLDADTGRAVRARLAQAQRHANSDVILDLTGVTFVDSVALTTVINGARALKDVARLHVISPPERVARIFAEAGLTGLFELTPDRRGEQDDRRKGEVPVSLDRRKAERRRMGDDGPDAARDDTAEPARNRA
jgi:anti-anti-sigma factor